MAHRSNTTREAPQAESDENRDSVGSERAMASATTRRVYRVGRLDLRLAVVPCYRVRPLQRVVADAASASAVHRRKDRNRLRVGEHHDLGVDASARRLLDLRVGQYGTVRAASVERLNKSAILAQTRSQEGAPYDRVRLLSVLRSDRDRHLASDCSDAAAPRACTRYARSGCRSWSLSRLLVSAHR